jgi:predicted HTH domain antitoxin
MASREFATMSKTVKVDLEVPPEVGDDAKAIAQTKAHEAAVLALWQEGKLTIREAAEELGLTYRELLELLATKGIPIERGPGDLVALEEARRKLAEGRP